MSTKPADDVLKYFNWSCRQIQHCFIHNMFEIMTLYMKKIDWTYIPVPVWLGAKSCKTDIRHETTPNIGVRIELGDMSSASTHTKISRHNTLVKIKKIYYSYGKRIKITHLKALMTFQAIHELYMHGLVVYIYGSKNRPLIYMMAG